MTMVKIARRWLRPVKRAYRTVLPIVLRPFMVSAVALVGDKRFRVPLIRGVGLENVWGTEPWMTDLLGRLLVLTGSRGLIDVGVNIGQTLLKLKAVDPTVRYLGFEPNPFCVFYANELIRSNGFESSCTIFPVALSDAPALHDFTTDGSEADGAGTMIADFRPRQQVSSKQYIAALVFDDIDLSTADVSLVKIDVEGAELYVLLGMKRFLQRTRPLVICEVLHAPSVAKVQNHARRNGAISRLLEEVGYSTFRLIKGTAHIDALEPVAAFPDEVWNSNTSRQLCDYLMVPKEHVDTVASTFARVTPIRDSSVPL